MHSPQKRLKVLLSAYACEPNRGSEPGVGWEWATRMGQYHDVTVLTRSNNRPVIEKEFSENGARYPVTFLYFDLPLWVIRLKKMGICPVFFYYLLWQVAASIKIRKSLMEFDLVHHVTFNGFRFPGTWWLAKSTPSVLGPLGGGSIAAPQFRRSFGMRWIMERIREFSITHWRWNPWTITSLRRARKVFVVGSDLESRFKAAGLNVTKMLETALPAALEQEPATMPWHSRKNFLWVGNLEPWKGWRIAIEAYAQAIHEGARDHKLCIVGSGSQLSKAKLAVSELDIADHVVFMGQKSRNEVWNLMASARALVFSSVRDTSGNVVLEAMGYSCPIVCFNHQGVAMMTDDTCAFRIEPRTWNESVEDFAKAIAGLANDQHLAERMGAASRVRATREFTWDRHVMLMAQAYVESLPDCGEAAPIE